MNHLINIARATALAGLIFGSVALSAPALAADDALPQGTINVHGADFASPAAVAHVKRAVAQTAAKICFGQAGYQAIASDSARTCYDTAVKDGLAQIDRRQQQAMRDRAVELADVGPEAHPAR